MLVCNLAMIYILIVVKRVHQNAVVSVAMLKRWNGKLLLNSRPAKARFAPQSKPTLLLPPHARIIQTFLKNLVMIFNQEVFFLFCYLDELN